VGEQSAILGVPRRVEALAYIVQRIERGGTSPSYGEIARAMSPAISRGRAQQYVDQLVALDLIERDPGSRRGIRIRDLHRCRVIIAQALGRSGWSYAQPLSNLSVQPSTYDQLPVIPLILHKRDLI